MSQGQLRFAREGETIFSEGDPGDSMYVLLEGAVELRKRVGKAETILKTVETANDFFGEMALIDGRPRSATAVASRASRLLVVDGPSFESMILTNGKFALKIIKVLSDRIRNSNAAIEDLHGTSPRDRFLYGLVEFAQGHGERIHDGRLKVDSSALRDWMGGRMGFSSEESEALIAKLVKGGTLAWSQAGATPNAELLVPEAVLRDYGRRGDEAETR